MVTFFSFVLIFGVLVFVHELGHLYFAKRAGILCREFAIGFGPKVVSFTKNETVYTIRLLPIGGFVRMAGEDPEVVEIKPGQTVGLLFNDAGNVNKILIDNYHKNPNAKVIQVANIDLEHDLYVEGYVDEEIKERYGIDEKAFIVEHGQKMQIAPYNRQFASKSIGSRSLAIFAGPLMNFVLAFVLFIAIGFIQGTPINKPILGKLTTDGAAYQAGLKQGDKIETINGKNTNSWEDVVSIVRANPEKEITMKIVRDGKELEKTVTPKLQDNQEGKYGIIGVYQPTEKSVFKALQSGFTETYNWTKELLVGLGSLITGKFSIEMLSGPIGIASMTGQVAQSGFVYLMKWTAVLSINLGVLNLLPLPALDGGRLLFFGIEALRGKPIDRQKEGMVHFIGFALLMLLMIVVTWNDIKKFFL
ncbi:MAG: RIP metalloprotease RseP [Bacillaceae bacterium]